MVHREGKGVSMVGFSGGNEIEADLSPKLRPAMR